MHEESKRQPKNHSQINESEPKSKEFCPIPRPIYHQTSIEINYEIVKTVGQGEFAKVKLGRCKRTGSEVAIKLINFDHRVQTNPRKVERIQREISILSALSHSNIVYLHEIIRLPDHIALVMEYAEGGELFEYVQRRGRLDETTARCIIVQVFKALSYMHERGIVHRDLKLENILMRKEKAGQQSFYESAIIIDFGFATYLNQETDRDDIDVKSSSTFLQTACGSPCYAAPELVLSKTGYRGEPADIWSCGVILYAMLFGHLPFEGDLKNEDKLEQAKQNHHCNQSKNVHHQASSTSSIASCQISISTVEKYPNAPQTSLNNYIQTDSINWTPSNVYRLYTHISRGGFRLPQTPKISNEASDLLLRLLNPVADNRVAMSEILSHPWILCGLRDDT